MTIRHDLLIVQDCSGSMLGIKQDAEGGLKYFLDTIKATEDVETIVWFYEFSNDRRAVYEAVPIAEVEDYVLRPSGGTALFDAVGQTIEGYIEHISELSEDERPDRVQLVIVTDGEENSSRHYNAPVIRTMVKMVLATGWDVVYIGTDEDLTQAKAMGIPMASSVSYVPDSQHTEMAYASAAGASSRSLTTNSGVAFNDEERKSTRSA